MGSHFRRSDQDNSFDGEYDDIFYAFVYTYKTCMVNPRALKTNQLLECPSFRGAVLSLVRIINIETFDHINW